MGHGRSMPKLEVSLTFFISMRSSEAIPFSAQSVIAYRVLRISQLWLWGQLLSYHVLIYRPLLMGHIVVGHRSVPYVGSHVGLASA